jgi:hypothetical protein
MCKLCEFSVQKVTPPPKLMNSLSIIRHRWGFAYFEHQRQYEPSQFSLNWNSLNSRDIKIGSQMALSHQIIPIPPGCFFNFLIPLLPLKGILLPRCSKFRRESDKTYSEKVRNVLRTPCD